MPESLSKTCCECFLSPVRLYPSTRDTDGECERECVLSAAAEARRASKLSAGAMSVITSCIANVVHCRSSLRRRGTKSSLARFWPTTSTKCTSTSPKKRKKQRSNSRLSDGNDVVNNAHEYDDVPCIAMGQPHAVTDGSDLVGQTTKCTLQLKALAGYARISSTPMTALFIRRIGIACKCA